MNKSTVPYIWWWCNTQIYSGDQSSVGSKMNKSTVPYILWWCKYTNILRRSNIHGLQGKQEYCTLHFVVVQIHKYTPAINHPWTTRSKKSIVYETTTVVSQSQKRTYLHPCPPTPKSSNILHQRKSSRRYGVARGTRPPARPPLLRRLKGRTALQAVYTRDMPAVEHQRSAR